MGDHSTQFAGGASATFPLGRTTGVPVSHETVFPLGWYSPAPAPVTLNCHGVCGDGTFVYCACAYDGLYSYSVDGSGNLTHVDTDDQGDGYNAVWSDGTFVFAACGAAGLRSYSVDGSGNLTYIDVDDQGGYYTHVWGDGTFVYVVDPTSPCSV